MTRKFLFASIRLYNYFNYLVLSFVVLASPVIVRDQELWKNAIKMKRLS